MTWRRLFASRVPVRQAASEAVPPSPEKLILRRLQGLAAWDAADAQRQDASTFLRSLPAQKLFDVDESLRRARGPSCPGWSTHALERIGMAGMPDSARQSLLFLACADGDGRIRHAALRTLPAFPGYLALAAALIRCSDWVENVRATAQATTERLLQRCRGEDVVALWPLVLRLRARERVSQQWFSDQVDAWMLQEPSRPWLHALIGHPRARVRAWAIRRCLDAGIRFNADLLALAMRDPDPGIALHALRHAQRRCDAARTRALADIGVCAAHPLVRRESLRALSQLQGALPREQVLAALCDVAAGVRSLGVFLLRDRHAEEPAAHWRAVLDSDASRPTVGALAALADHGRPEDEARMRRWLGGPSSLVRSLALRGLIKAGGQLSDAQFAAFVASGGNRAVGMLVRYVRTGDVPVDVERIAAVVCSPASTEDARRTLREVVVALEHWTWLALVLAFSATDEPARQWWRQAIADWAARGDVYAPLGPHRRLTLLDALEARREEMPLETYKVIGAAIGRH